MHAWTPIIDASIYRSPRRTPYEASSFETSTTRNSIIRNVRQVPFRRYSDAQYGIKIHRFLTYRCVRRYLVLVTVTSAREYYMITRVVCWFVHRFVGHARCDFSKRTSPRMENAGPGKRRTKSQGYIHERCSASQK